MLPVTVYPADTGDTQPASVNLRKAERARKGRFSVLGIGDVGGFSPRDSEQRTRSRLRQQPLGERCTCLAAPYTTFTIHFRHGFAVFQRQLPAVTSESDRRNVANPRPRSRPDSVSVQSAEAEPPPVCQAEPAHLQRGKIYHTRQR
jgi:hypothetical protein